MSKENISQRTTAPLSNQKWQIIFLCIFSLLVTFYCQNQTIFNRYIFREDLRGNIYWMVEARNLHIFTNDIIAGFSSFFVSPLLKWFYKVMSFMGVELLAKLLAFPLCSISAIYMFKLGEKIGGRYCGLFAGTLFVLTAWCESEFDFFGIGDAGDFFPPLGAIFLYYFLVDNTIAMTPLLILQAALYPPIFLISMACFTVSVFSNLNAKRIIVYAFVLTISFLILFNNFRKAQLRDFGDTYSAQEISNMDEFKEGGRVPLIYPSLLRRIFNNRSGVGKLDGRLGLLLILFLTSIVLYMKGIRCVLPFRVLLFLLVSLMFAIFANIFMLRIFEPSRYLLLSVPLVLICIISSPFSKLINLLSNERNKTILSLLIIMLFSALFFQKVKPKYVIIKNVGVYTFLESIPNNSLIAGHPFLLDNIPLLTRKKVFLTSEASLPYFKKYYAEIQKRTYDFFKAYYSGSLDKVIRFCRENNIDYLVVRKNDFSKDYLEEKIFYYQPYNKFILWFLDNKANFALLSVPNSLIAYNDQEYLVFKCL